MRPYHQENTQIHPNLEVKLDRARLVLKWGTIREARVLHVFFCSAQHHHPLPLRATTITSPKLHPVKESSHVHAHHLGRPSISVWGRVHHHFHPLHFVQEPISRDATTHPSIRPLSHHHAAALTYTGSGNWMGPGAKEYFFTYLSPHIPFIPAHAHTDTSSRRIKERVHPCPRNPCSTLPSVSIDEVHPWVSSIHPMH